MSYYHHLCVHALTVTAISVECFMVILVILYKIMKIRYKRFVDFVLLGPKNWVRSNLHGTF